MRMGEYRLMRLLGKGGFGEVHLATRDQDAGQVALKVLRLPNDANERRFFREAQILHQQLAKPHVVDLLDWSFETDPAYIVMEFCSGGSLRSWVGQRLDWRQIAYAISHAAVGLTGIHGRGGFHRDVKPDNLLVAVQADGGMTVKLGDFGLARAPHLSSSGPMTRSAMGTHGYIAPELSFGGAFDTRCDVYSLGVTGIELLTGSRDPASLAIRADAPKGLHDLLRQMVGLDPLRRPTITGCQNVLAELVAAKPVPAPAPAAAKKSDGGGALAFLAGLAVAAAGVAALATMNEKDDNGKFHGNDGRFRAGRWS